MSRADEILAKGDAMAVVKMALGARFAAEGGRYCECENPTLVGYDLMCGDCLLENEAQIARRTAWINGPHGFVPHSETLDRFCKVCSYLDDDPRHGSSASPPEGAERPNPSTGPQS